MKAKEGEFTFGKRKATGYKKVSDYTYELRLVSYYHCLNPEGMYYGREGALRFAREYAVGLLDFPEKDAREELKCSYGKLCVLCYDLKPPIDASEWIGEIIRMWESEHTYMTSHGEVTEKLNARWLKGNVA